MYNKLHLVKPVINFKFLQQIFNCPTFHTLGQSDGAWRCSGEGRYCRPRPSQQVSPHPWSQGIGNHSRSWYQSIKLNSHIISIFLFVIIWAFLESPLLSFSRWLVMVLLVNLLFSLVSEVCYPRCWTRQQTKWERAERSKKESDRYISGKSQQSTAYLPENHCRTQKGINRLWKTAQQKGTILW